MQEFDRKLWIDRAAARLRRGTRRGTPPEERAAAEVRWLSDVININRLEILIGWCHSKGIRIIFRKKEGATYYTEDKSISMSGRLAPEKQLIMLLHECGHHLIGHVPDSDRFGKGYPCIEDSSINATFHHRLACLEEEIEAWNRGWRLATRLKLNINREDFDAVRVACLRTYVRWANVRSKIRSK